jgi:hypothetical protein
MFTIKSVAFATSVVANADVANATDFIVNIVLSCFNLE